MGLRNFSAQEGTTTPFGAVQFEHLLASVEKVPLPPNVDRQTRDGWRPRLRALILVMRGKRACQCESKKITGYPLRLMITQLARLTGNPRSACRRFVRRMGNKAKNNYKRWPVSEQERMLEMLDNHCVSEVADRMPVLRVRHLWHTAAAESKGWPAPGLHIKNPTWLPPCMCISMR
jgi:hypothetical protein